jgi:RHS repeat-associated protein
VHQDPLVKSKRVTNSAGTVVSTIELDPWGGDTNRNNNEAFQPRRFTTYDRDGNASDDAMHRRYNRWHSRFDQPDPYGGSYDITDPQSFNRYSYVQNDPVNFVDPSGLCPRGTVAQPDARGEMQCVGVGVESVDINISGGRLTGGVGGTSSGAIEIEIGGSDPGGTVGDFDLPGITRLVDAFISAEDCAKFAQTILDQLSGKGPTLYDVFNAFFNQKHDLFTRIRPAGSLGEASTLGSLKKSTARMFLRRDPDMQTELDAMNVVQELFHFAGKDSKGYSDEQLAKALHKTEYSKMAAEVFPNGRANIFDKRYVAGNWVPADAYSTYFHGIANRFCGSRPPNIYR